MQSCEAFLTVTRCSKNITFFARPVSSLHVNAGSRVSEFTDVQQRSLFFFSEGRKEGRQIRQKAVFFSLAFDSTGENRNFCVRYTDIRFGESN